MRRLPVPESIAIDVLAACIKSIRDGDLTARLQEVKPHLEAAELAYIAHGRAAILHMVQGALDIGGRVTAGEMERVYKSTFVKSKATREIYGKIRAAPENDICPLCSQRTVSQLDHYLPQSAHPALTITPINLVPACSECNKNKLAIQANQQNDQTFHPYFEDCDDARWLYATVVETSPAALVFSPIPPPRWSDVKRQRVLAHFKLYKLGELYASHSAVELNDIRYGLVELAKKNTPHEVAEHLRSTARSRAHAHENSWRRATYEALAESLWFCSGGFTE